MPIDPNLPIPQYPILEPTSALDFNDLVTEVAYKIGCAYYGSTGTGAPQAPIDAHDLAVCQRIVNKAVRKFINDGPMPNGWRWLNVISQTDLWPQISYDPTGATFVVLAYQTSGPYIGCTIATLATPSQSPYNNPFITPPPQPVPLPTPPFGYQDGDTSYVPRFLASMEMRQIWLNGNPPSGSPGFFLPIDEDFTGSLIGNPFTVLRYLSPTQLLLDGNATLPIVAVGGNIIALPTFATGGTYTITVTTVVSVQTTAAITYTPGSTHANYLTNAAAIQSALQALSNVGASNATVVVDGGGLYTTSWDSSLGVGVYATLGTNSLTGSQTTAPFSFACSGDYTLPANFGGQYTGAISYVANTNRGMVLQWISEFAIRSRRQNYNIESGTPYECAVRLIPTPSYAPLTNSAGIMLPRHRWELMTWRISSEFLSVIFPYTLSFNDLVNTTDVPPSPLGFDEALKACCLAVAEKEVDDTMGGPDWEYYHSIALVQAHQLDARSAPRKLGYFSNPTSEGTANPIEAFRDYWYQRPVVSVFGRS